MAGSESNEALAAKIYSFGLHIAADSSYALGHPGEAAAALAAWTLLNTNIPNLAKGGPLAAAHKIAELAQKYLNGSQSISPTPSPGGPVPMPYPNYAGALGGPPQTINLPAVQKNLQELQQKMQKQSLMTSVLTNIANMKHEG
jgi:hypothetical protein